MGATLLLQGLTVSQSSSRILLGLLLDFLASHQQRHGISSSSSSSSSGKHKVYMSVQLPSCVEPLRVALAQGKEGIYFFRGSQAAA